MMNGSGGYEYTYGNSINTAAVQQLQHQQQHQGGYLAAPDLSPAVGPSAAEYDPTIVSQENANEAQHQLFLAYIAANYAQDAVAAHHQSQQQQQQLQMNNHAASNATMAAFLGAAPFQASLPAVAAAAYQQQRAAPNIDLSPLPYAQQQPSRQHSFDDLLFLHQSAQSHSMASSIDDSYYPMNVTSQHHTALHSNGNSSTAEPVLSQHEAWLEEIHLVASSISLEPMSGRAVVNRLQEKMNDVLTKYVPCVDFLVQCQQDLRKGLDFANSQKRYGGRNSRGMPARQFYTMYIHPLAQTFYTKNRGRMDQDALHEAYAGLEKLQQDARNVERQGCDAVKSTFLGGMKDGESWGLRKWLSKHGSALTICTDLECILNACQKLDRGAESTKKLAEMLRPMAQQVLNRLQTDIPASYQQQSTAHPYLPFFHRLESALRGMSKYNPDEDDVICLDSDSDDDDVVAVDIVRSSHNASFKPPVATTRKRLPQSKIQADDSRKNNKRACKDPSPPLLNINNNSFDDDSSSGESECASVVDIIDGKLAGGEWACPSCSMVNASTSSCCLACGEEGLLKEFGTIPGLEDFFDEAGTPASFDSGFLQQDSGSELNIASPIMVRPPLWPIPLDQPHLQEAAAYLIAGNLDKLANIFDRDQQAAVRGAPIPEGSFWDGERFGSALRLFAQLLRMPESSHFLDRVDDDRLLQAGNCPLFSHVIKHPLSIRDIAQALLGADLQLTTKSDGGLSVRGLSSWNMWAGKDLLQAIDLVFLNTLAYGNALNQGKSHHRSLTNKIRKVLWNGITDIVGDVDAERRKQCMPTRRSEKSGFIVYKIDES